MKKLITLVAAVLTMAVLLAGCGNTAPSSAPDGASSESKAPSESKAEPVATANEDSKDSLTIGLSMYTLEYPFYVKMHDAFLAACKTKGWEVVATDANTDVAVQLNDCMDMLNKDIDALAFSSWYGDALADVFDTCETQDIPVFMMDTSTYPEGASFVTIIGTVNYDAGYVGGKWTGKYYVDKGITTLDIIAMHSGDQVSTSRRDGFIDGMKEAGLTLNILNEYHSKSREEAMASAEDALVTYSKIDLILATSAQHGMGAYSACEAANRSEMKIVAMDGEQEEMDVIDKGGIYLCTVMQFPDAMAEKIVEDIENYVLNGVSPEKVQSSPAGVYGPEGVVTADKI